MPNRRATRAGAPAPGVVPPPVAIPKIPPAVAPAVNVVPIPANPIPREDFGHDKDLKILLKNIQPKIFKGEGTDVPAELEEWMLAMDDYFSLAGYNTLAQGLMGQAKLEGSAKIWWKLHC